MRYEDAMQVDIYDFDKTAVPYDSAMRYSLWCLVHRPYLFLLLPWQLFWSLLAFLRIIPVSLYKRICFRYVTFINTEKTVKGFWDKHQKDVYPFFLPENRNADRKCVLISASPEFLISEIASRMNVDYCIATPHDLKTGRLLGKVCRRDEKVNRFRQLLQTAEVCDVYSDSLRHDKYIFELGKRRFLARKGNLIPLENIEA